MILAYLGPKLLGVDLEAECKRYEKELSVGGPEGGMQSAYRRLDVRAYRIGDRLPPGTTVADAESLHTSVGDAVRIFVERLRRDGKFIEFKPTMVLQPGMSSRYPAGRKSLSRFSENMATRFPIRHYWICRRKPSMLS